MPLETHYVRKSDGKTYNSIMDAVREYKCPGPCADGLCKLHEMVNVGTHAQSYMCHNDYVNAHPDEIASRLGLTEIQATVSEEKSYIAVIKGEAVRDCQVCRDDNHDPLESEWYDYENPSIYLGIFKADSREEALNKAAEYAGVCTYNIDLIDIPANPV